MIVATNKKVDVDIVKEVIPIPAAYELLAVGVGTMDKTKIEWDDLRSAPTGKQWVAAAGGSLYAGGNLYHDSHTATLVYRDDCRAVLMIEHEYRDGTGRTEHQRKLVAFRF